MIDHIRRAGFACLAMIIAVAPVAQAAPTEQTIRNGGMLKIGATYYWYGVKYAEAVAYAQAPRAATPQPHFNAVTAYSSTDLHGWNASRSDYLTAPRWSAISASPSASRPRSRCRASGSTPAACRSACTRKGRRENRSAWTA